jgi:hypothetical protein
MEPHEVINLIFRALRDYNVTREINDVAYDGDFMSAEVVLTTDDGEKLQDWVISSETLVEAERPSG